jgi:hypothetical protein
MASVVLALLMFHARPLITHTTGHHTPLHRCFWVEGGLGGGHLLEPRYTTLKGCTTAVATAAAVLLQFKSECMHTVQYVIPGGTPCLWFHGEYLCMWS